jgi:hypothetical protein
LPRPRLRRLAVSAFVALALVGAPVSGGVAQAAPPPKPRELWRQFPLETKGANQDARANGRATPRVAPQTSVGTPEDQGWGSPVTVQRAGIVLAMALVFILMMGALVYVQHRSLELTTRRRSRRSTRPFRRSDDLRHAGRTAWRQVGTASSSLRRATGSVAAASNAARAAAASFHAGIVSEAAALKTQLRARAVHKNNDRIAIDAVASPAADKPAAGEAHSAQGVPVQEAAAAGTLKGRLDLYLDPVKSKSTAHANLDRLMAEPDPHHDLPRSPAEDELEILKAKLGKPAAQVDDLRADEVETFNKPAPPEAHPAQGVPEQEAAAAGTLKDRLDLYLDPVKSKSTAHANPDKLKGEPDPHLDIPTSPADDELEILKAKLGKPAAQVDDLRADEVETLMAKLGGEKAGPGGMTTRNELKRKLADRHIPLKAVSRDAEVELLKTKLEALDQVANADAAASGDLGTHAAIDEPQRGRAADLKPPPSDASAAPARSRANVPVSWKLTASPSGPSSGKAARSRRSRKHWFLLELEGEEPRRRPETPDGTSG